MRCAILQPHYLPWVGYFEMLDRVDLFVLFDDAHFNKGEWKNRNRIRMERKGERTRWLTVPVARTDQHDTPLNLIRIDRSRNWAAMHLRNIALTYQKTRYYSQYMAPLAEIIESETAYLGELNEALLRFLASAFGIQTPIVRSSETPVGGAKTERVANICQAVGADAYLANNGSSGYLEPEVFAARGIEWSYQDYSHPTWLQWSVWYEGRPADLPFIPYLSAIDLLFNHGPDSLAILRSGRPADDA